MLFAALLFQDLFPIVPGDSWRTEVTYTYRSVEYPSESQVWVWHETREINPTFDLNVSGTLLKNCLDSLDLPLPSASVPDVWIVRDPFMSPVREPVIDDVTTYRLWRLVQIPLAGQPIHWKGSQKWPSAIAKSNPVGELSSSKHPITLSFSEPGGMQAKGSGFCAPDGTFRSGKMKVERAFLPGGDGSPQRLEIVWTEVKG